MKENLHSSCSQSIFSAHSVTYHYTTTNLPFLSIMGDAAGVFDPRIHCDRDVQQELGLSVPNVKSAPRVGDRTIEGEIGKDIMGAIGYRANMTEDQARITYDLISEASKTTVNDPATAHALAAHACNAGKPPPTGSLRHFVNGRWNPDNTTNYFINAGGPLFRSLIDAKKFIAFVYANQDPESRCTWNSMTGHQQWEWYRAWLRSGETHQRRPEHTLGLMGTNTTARIQNANQLRAALAVSPTLSNCTRPTGIDEAVWTAALGSVRRELIL